MNRALEQLSRLIGTSPIYSINSYNYFIFPFKGLSPIRVNLLRELVDLMKEDLSTDNYKIFTFMGDGLTIALPLALAVDKPLIIARDFHYNISNIRSFIQKTNYYKRKMYFSGLEGSDKVEIVDCIVSSGGSVLGAVDEMEKVGCQVLGIHTLIDKVDYGGATRIRERGYRFTSLLDVRILDNQIHVYPSMRK